MMFQKCMTPLECTLFSKFNREEKINIFFSTTWCRDKLFTSENPNDILKFYDTFSNRDELIQWMKERPKGRAEIIEVEGDKEIIVVIPTADFNGKYAKECRENIFKGLHTVFVESGFPKDPYFNYAHNCNVGIKKAIEYNPKWIVISNDDMIKIDDVEILKNNLESIDSKAVGVVFTDPSEYHSVRSKLTRRNWFTKKYLMFKNKTYGKTINLLLDKFHVDVTIVKNSGFRKYFTEKGFSYVDLIGFFVLSNDFAKVNMPLFDENFINEGEDSDFSLRIATNKITSTQIEYKIGDMVGSTLGRGHDRALRGIAGVTYFDYKWKKLIEKRDLAAGQGVVP
ncbi:MAG: hypothetical protein QW292_11625 [Candidatus Parvarchaeota archaeon]